MKPNYAGGISTNTTGLTRAWEYWSMRVAKAGGAVSAAESQTSRRGAETQCSKKEKACGGTQQEKASLEASAFFCGQAGGVGSLRAI